MASLTSLIVHIALLAIVRASLVEDYAHFAALDPDEKFKLYWSIDKATQTVSFALDSATTGWVGFGISTGQGKMDKADMLVGWVKDGQSYLTDRHGVGHFPQVDDHNDYKLISGEESNGRTILKFSRKIDTCDQQDIKLQEGTTKVIFALNDQDPSSPNTVMKHTFKGARSLLLLNSQGKRNKPDPSWKYFDILNRNYTVPAKDTTYHCSVHKIPEFTEKQHIVRFEPVIQHGNEGVVHHFVVVVCDPNFPEHYSNVSRDCNDFQNMPAEVTKCQLYGIMTAVWAVGGGPFLYPDHVGFPLGTEFVGRHLVIEVHYDNPTLRKGIIDSSGVRFYYTSKLREYDSSVWVVGSFVSHWMMIPPKQEAWETTGYCSKQTTEKLLRNSSLPNGGIKMFSSLLHTHLAGRQTWTQHVRDGVELPEIARDNNYDFNFQDIQRFTSEVDFKPGDEIIHTCIYNTLDRNNVTYGGESTREEMCLNFIFYYPMIPQLSMGCMSNDLKAGVDVINKHFPSLSNKGSALVNPFRKSNITWTKEASDDYKAFINKEKTVFDLRSNLDSWNLSIATLLTDKYQTPKVKITTPLPEPKDDCHGDNVDSSARKLVVFYHVLSACVALVLFEII